MTGEIVVRPASSNDRPAWNSFVHGREEASIAHLHEWSEVFSSAYGKRSHDLLATRGGECLGVLPLVHMRGPLTGNRLVSLPFLDQGGILAGDAAARRALWDAALRLGESLGVRGIDLRGPGVEAPAAAGEPRRFRFLLSLEGSQESLWRAIGPKVRNQIRKSEREGLATRVAAADELDVFYSVLARNMRDLGSPVHSHGFFASLLNTLGSRVAVFLTHDRGARPVAGAMALRMGDTVTVPWASSLRSARPLCPNHSLYWGILRQVQERGARRFDFGRSSIGSGTFHFKKQWRAQAEPLHWHSYDRAGRPENDPTLSPVQHGGVVAAWRHLPLGMANRLGPLIRRQLAN